MSFEESIESRQNNELEALKAIYGDDLKDLRGKTAWNKWTPLNLKIVLKPSQGASGIQEVYATVELHLTCDGNYPKSVPKIALENSKGLSANSLQELQKMLEVNAALLKGEEMIFQLSQCVQDFLHIHNKPTSKSFYDEMLARQKEQEEKIQQAKQIERQSLQQEVKQRQEMLKSESRMRRYNSESESNNSLSISEECCGCKSKQQSFVVKFKDRDIQKGRCLKHATTFTVYLGIDVKTGETVLINEWLIKLKNSTDETMINKQLSSIDQELNYLTTLRHSNLSCYLALQHNKVDDDLIAVYILTEYIQGTCCSFFRNDHFNTYNIQFLRHLLRGVVTALDYLHRNNVVHKNINESNIYLNEKGLVILTNYSLHKRLGDLCKSRLNSYNKKTDIYDLGRFVISFVQESSSSASDDDLIIPTTLSSDLYDFVTKCLTRDERERPTTSQLLIHPFFSQDSNDEKPSPKQSITEIENCENDANFLTKSPQSILPSFNNSSQSRLSVDFTLVQHLGKGAFGDVIKVQNLLDDRYYAIKRIRLNPKNRQLNKKIVREVKLLSSLDHENVVRYYNSWIESTTIDSDDEKTEDSEELKSTKDTGPQIIRRDEFTINDNIEELAPSLKNVSITFDSKSQMMYDSSSEDDEDDSSDDDAGWGQFNQPDTDSSDGIEFEKDSNSESETKSNAVANNLNNSESASNNALIINKAYNTKIEYLYIQMEFCDKSTLRSAIDNGLYKEEKLVLRLFREIIEGLGYIHEQGMIHRDLKPVNIFLDHDYHVKIGDFGLATNIKKQATNLMSQTLKNTTFNDDNLPDESKTGQIGTALYVAPELTVASKAIYNQKVDIYSLGIIFFEMTYRTFDTTMERIKILTGLRNKLIHFPDDYDDKKYAKHKKLLEWLLDHDFSKRPTCKELLKSEYVPPPILEERELRELIRHTLNNPHLKDYKYLIAACFDQCFTPAQDVTYDKDPTSLTMIKHLPLYDMVKNSIVQIFKLHGGQNFNTPLLMPKSHYYEGVESCVRLMTHFGGIVSVPHDLRVPFARFVASNNIQYLRRFAIERVYREKRVFGFQPRELYECAFDIVTPTPGNLITDAEILYIVYEIIKKLPGVKDKTFLIKLNHALLLKAILLHFDVKENHQEIFKIILEDRDKRDQKNQLQDYLIRLGLSDNSITTLTNLFNSEYEIDKATKNLQMITKRQSGIAANLAKQALNELKSIANMAELFGVNFEILIAPGMVYNAHHYSGMICQFVCELKKKHKQTDNVEVLAAGGRYDSMIQSYRKIMEDANVLKQSAVGISISLDKLVQAVLKSQSSDDELGKMEPLDCAVCSVGSKQLIKDKLKIGRLLWNVGIKCLVIESTNNEEIQEQCNELKIPHLIMLKDNEQGTVRVRSWEHGRFQEKTCMIQELVDDMQTILKNWKGNSGRTFESIHHSASSNLAKSESKSSYQERNEHETANVSVLFVTIEKLSSNARKRYEIQIRSNLENLLLRLNGYVTVLGLCIDGSVLKTIASYLNFESDQLFHNSVGDVIERHQRHKKYINYICDEIYEQKLKKTKPIIILFSLIDSSHKIIL